MVVEQLVVSASQFVNFVHVVFYNVRNVQIEFVGCFTMLEVNVRVFCSTTSYRSIWIQCIFTECINSIHINHWFQIFIVPDFDFLNFVGCTETVKEVDEWYTSFNSCQVSYSGQVHYFLYRGFSKHSAASCTSSHYVLVVTEDSQSMCSQCTSSYLEYTWK